MQSHFKDMNYEREIQEIVEKSNEPMWLEEGAKIVSEDCFEKLLALAKKMQEEIIELKWKLGVKKFGESFIEDPWIPCSERLPEKFGCYLVTVKVNGILLSRSFECYFLENSKEWDYVTDRRAIFPTGEIIAWMPLPEPFKE